MTKKRSNEEKRGVRHKERRMGNSIYNVKRKCNKKEGCNKKEIRSHLQEKKIEKNRIKYFT